jgi:hypothetical protein
MSRAVLLGAVGVVATCAGLVWLFFRSRRTTVDDFVPGHVLARINVEYHDPS